MWYAFTYGISKNINLVVFIGMSYLELFRVIMTRPDKRDNAKVTPHDDEHRDALESVTSQHMIHAHAPRHSTPRGVRRAPTVLRCRVGGRGDASHERPRGERGAREYVVDAETCPPGLCRLYGLQDRGARSCKAIGMVGSGWHH